MAAVAASRGMDVNDLSTGRFRSLEMTYINLTIPKAQAALFVAKVADDFGCIQFVDLLEDAREPAGDAGDDGQKERGLRHTKDLSECVRDEEALKAYWSVLDDKQKATGGGQGWVKQADGTELKPGELADFMKEKYQETVENPHIATFEKKVQGEEEKLALIKMVTANQPTANAQSFRRGANPASRELEPLKQEDDKSVVRICGVIPLSRYNHFQRALYMKTRGNLIMEHLGDEEENGTTKRFFRLTTLGNTIKDGIKKRGSAFDARFYECVTEKAKGGSRLMTLQNSTQFGASMETLSLDEILWADLDLVRSAATASLAEFKQVLYSAVGARKVELDEIGANIVASWRDVQQKKAVFATLNMSKKLDDSDLLPRYELQGWVPSLMFAEVSDYAKSFNRGGGGGGGEDQILLTKQTPVPKNMMPPPTGFVTNKVSGAFQSIVDAYAVARYQELNPTPYTIITFPFLFGVMFGDVGHGLMLLIMCLYFVFNEKSMAGEKLNDMVDMVFGGRYVLLLMSIASIYCGLLYNETFGIPHNLFGSRWAQYAPDVGTFELAGTQCALASAVPAAPFWRGNCTLPPAEPYPFGLDPAWKWADNGLTFNNSLKMKMAVILGVTQMLFGIMLKGVNNWVDMGKGDTEAKLNARLSFWFEFIPQVIFMVGIFGYMCFLIILKWNICWVSPGDTTSLTVPFSCTGRIVDSDGPPDIKQILIGMFMKYGAEDPNYVLYSGMNTVQSMMVPFLLVMPLLMLLPKPLILNAFHKKKCCKPADTGGQYGSVSRVSDEASADGEDSHFDFAEEFIHQVIETIEFVLGSVSNTASYLRLWALSLAHSQLTDVFYDKVLTATVDASATMGVVAGGFAVFAAFAVWLAMTVAVLLCMESLSAFLHALRLHWVEFNNKFYNHGGHGLNIPYTPMTFKNLRKNPGCEE